MGFPVSWAHHGEGILPNGGQEIRRQGQTGGLKIPKGSYVVPFRFFLVGDYTILPIKELHSRGWVVAPLRKKPRCGRVGFDMGRVELLLQYPGFDCLCPLY